METAPYLCEVSIAIDEVQRISIQRIQGPWNVLMAEEQTWLHTGVPTDSTSVPYLCPNSPSHLWFPQGVCFLMIRFEITGE